LRRLIHLLLLVFLVCLSTTPSFAQSSQSDQDLIKEPNFKQRTIVPVSHPHQPALPKYDGMNLLFIIDQSGSMGGTQYSGDPIYGPTGQDPLDLRFYAPQFALDWLESWLTSRSIDISAMPDINIAMVAFGTQPRILLDWTNVYKNYAVVGDWDALRTSIYEAMSNERFRASSGLLTNLGYTNFQEAFREGKRVLDNAPKDKNYLSAVIVLTDGGPCTPEYVAVCFSFGTDSFPVQHLKNLKEITDSQFANVEMFLIAIDAVTPKYWDALSGYWRDIVCPPTRPVCDDALRLFHVSVDASSDPSGNIIKQFNQVLSYLANVIDPGSVTSTPLNPDGTFEVPPYVQTVRLNIFKTFSTPLPDESLQITQPDGSAPQRVAIINPDKPVETREIPTPYPGVWKAVVSDSSLVEKVEFIADFIRPSAKATLNDQAMGPLKVEQFTPINFQLDIVDAVGVPLPVYMDASGQPDADLSLKVTITVYDGTSTTAATRIPTGETFTLSLDTVNFKDRNVFIGTWTPMIDGIYEFRVDATYVYKGNTEHLLSGLSIFDGLTVTPIYIAKSGLAKNSELEGVGIPVEAVVMSKDTGVPVTWDTSGFVTELEVIMDDGTETVVNPKHIEANTADEPGKVTTSLSLGQPGKYKVKMRVGRLDEAGTFVPLDLATDTYFVTIRPVRPLAVSIVLDPKDESVSAQLFEFNGKPPFFWKNRPLRLQVEVRDTSTGQPTSVQGLSIAGNVGQPTLLIKEGDKETDLTDQLVEGPPGIYSVTVDDLGTGDYEFVASLDIPDDELTGDYLYKTRSATTKQSRNFASFFFGLLGGGIGILGLVFLGGKTLYSRNRINSLYPMRGNVTVLFVGADDDLANAIRSQTFPLEQYRKNKKTFKGGNAHPFDEITFQRPIPAKSDEKSKKTEAVRSSNLSSESSMKDRIVQVTYLKAGGKVLIDKSASPKRLSPDGHFPTVWKNEKGEYKLAKDFSDQRGGDPFSSRSSNIDFFA
jgi:hypothetical protein